MLTSYSRFTNFSHILLVLALVGYATSTDFIWSPTLFLNNTQAADWNTAENWIPQGNFLFFFFLSFFVAPNHHFASPNTNVGIPTTSDTVSFPASVNISATSNQPTSISSLRIDAPINVSFVSSLTVSGIVRYLFFELLQSYYTL
jgi:hypothetical protein